MPVGIGGMGVTGWVTGEVILCKVEPDQVPDSDKETYPEGVFVVDTNRKPSCILSEEATFTDLD